MKAAVFHGKHRLVIEEIGMPCVDDDAVLIQIKACGVCGTDIHIFNGDEGAAKTPPGTVLGHEFSGVVVETGKAVTGVAAGDRVCVDPNRLCGNCFYCKSGIGHFCESMTGIGTTVNGGLAEYCAVPQTQVYKLADNVSFEEGAMAEPLACCLHGIDLCGVTCADTVMIIGGGMIGMLMLQLAALSGAAKLIVVEPVRRKRELAEQLGADLCIDPVSGSVAEVLKREGVQRISKVIECVGRTETMEQALAYAGKKSTVMLFGLTRPQDKITLNPFELFKKELELKASYINPYTQQRAVTLINSGKVDVASLLYRAAPLQELPSILADAQLRSQGKFVITP